MSLAKKIVATIACLTLCVSSFAFAGNGNKVDLNSKADWMMDNVKPTTFVGIKENPYTRSASSGWIKTQTHYTDVDGASGPVAGMETQARWMCENLDVVDWSTVKFNGYLYSGSAVLNSHDDEAIMAPNNIRMIYQIDVVDITGSYAITHLYNLHGNGTYDLRIED